ncbi:MAG: OadG family protein [Firmicutes bacterium]|nr:OadG family protein [Candidatus Caballimonas caccae]
MFFFRHRIAFGAIIALVVGAVKVALDIVYKVLKLLKIQFLAAVLFVGAILFIFKVIPENTKVLITLIVFVALGFLYFIFGNMHRINKFFSKFQRESKKSEKEENSKEELKEEVITKQEEQNIENNREETIKQDYPKYYAVKEHKNYVMAEYQDRYVLYRRENGKLYKIRTDRKD